MAIDNTRLYHEAQEAVRVQKELDYLKDLFVSIAGHELRTPLTTIRGFGQMLQRSLLRQPEPLDPEAHQEALVKNLHFLDTIHRQTNRMNGLISQLLDFSRIQSGQFELTEIAEVDLVNLLEQRYRAAKHPRTEPHPDFQDRGNSMRSRRATATGWNRYCTTLSATPASTARKAARSWWN